MQARLLPAAGHVMIRRGRGRGCGIWSWLRPTVIWSRLMARWSSA